MTGDDGARSDDPGQPKPDGRDSILDRPEIAGLIGAPENASLREAMEALAFAGGDGVSAIILYGSHVQGSAPTVWSAYDLLVVTDNYGRFYRSLAGHGHHRRSPRLLTILAYVLPPNIVAFDLNQPDQPISKCAVFNSRHFRRGLGSRAQDHFLKGRVVQKLALLWVRSPEDEAMVMDAIRAAREDTTRWVRPFLPEPFHLEEFTETMLRVSYGGEIRPEHPDRVTQVFTAQRKVLARIAGESLKTAEAQGRVVSDGDEYRWTKPPGQGARIMMAAYFTLSKVRATARWFKYAFTFDGWLDYAKRKVERRAGLDIKVSDRERKWPLIFLWPKFFRVLRLLRQNDLPPQDTQEPMSRIGKEGKTE